MHHSAPDRETLTDHHMHTQAQKAMQKRVLLRFEDGAAGHSRRIGENQEHPAKRAVGTPKLHIAGDRRRIESEYQEIVGHLEFERQKNKQIIANNKVYTWQKLSSSDPSVSRYSRKSLR